MSAIYDRDGNKIPSREFLSMVIVLLRRCEVEVGNSLFEWLEELNRRAGIEPGDGTKERNDKLRLAISKLMKDYHPEEPKPLNPADWIDEDDEEMPLIEAEPDSGEGENA